MTPFPSDPLLPAAAAVLGLLLGSFYNVCIHRYLAGESVVSPRSRCPACTRPLAWYELVPVASWLALRGRCRTCRAPVSVRYPLVEALSGAAALLLFVRFGLSAEFFVYLAFFGLFIVLSFIDFASYLLPDVMTLPGLGAALAAGSFVLPVGPVDSLIGAAAGSGFFFALQLSYRLLRGREGLGTGDVKLMAVIGALIGWKGLPMAAFMAACAALLASLFYAGRGVKATDLRLPFGPFLCLGAAVYVLYGPKLWAWYVGW